MHRRRFLTALNATACASALWTPAASGSHTLPPTHPLLLLSSEKSLPTDNAGKLARQQKIKVLGVGDFGCSVADRVRGHLPPEIEYVFAYGYSFYDEVHMFSGQECIRLSRPCLRRYTSLSERVTATDETVVNSLRSALEGTDILFIVAGLGGYSGSRAAPVISLIAREMGIVTIGVVTFPGDWEMGRPKNANHSLIELETSIDSLIVLSQDKLFESLGTDDFTENDFSDYCMTKFMSAIRVMVDKTKECQSARYQSGHGTSSLVAGRKNHCSRLQRIDLN